jgi:mannose-6-phosphate isomerase-like protein (cupin superfamily)
MFKHIALTLTAAAILAGGALYAQQPAGQAPRRAAEPAPPAPAPGSPAIYRDATELAAVLTRNIAATPDMASSPVVNTDQYRASIVHRGKGAGPIAHPGNTELHYVIEGAATVVTGGTIVRPAAGSNTPANVNGGETRQVKKGDILIIPAGSTHWYKDVQTPVTYLEVRFVAPTK